MNFDNLGQVISGKKRWSDGTPVAGQQFEYTFDDIGNRTTAGADGDQNGNNLRYQSYAANDLNQYTSRTVPGYVQSLGTAATNARVVIWGDGNEYTTAYRHGSYFWGELEYDNSDGPLWLNLTNLAAVPGGTNADLVASTQGHVYLPGATESFAYDLDGNLTADAQWNYTWDAENRLISMAARTAVGPQISLKFDYDSQGRRIRQQVWSNPTWSGTPTNDLRFAYDGWNLLATLDPQLSPLNTSLWGLDLSGSPQGAGGVGGLLVFSEISNSGITNCFPAFDGNGNVTGLIGASDGSLAAQYEYGPFGEVIRATGPMANANPFRFSTKYQEDEADLLYYSSRYLHPLTGKWLGRDPLGDEQGLTPRIVISDFQRANTARNPCMFAVNDPISCYDALGLWPSSHSFLGTLIGLDTPMTHQRAIKRAIPGLPRREYAILYRATREVDEDQDVDSSYEHAMRAGGPTPEPTDTARRRANNYVRIRLISAKILLCGCSPDRDEALHQFGKALHTIQDATSPAHNGFQIWNGVPGHRMEALLHVEREDFDPGSGSNLDRATAWLWTFFNCPTDGHSALPPDFFSNLRADPEPPASLPSWPPGAP